MESTSCERRILSINILSVSHDQILPGVRRLGSSKCSTQHASPWVCELKLETRCMEGEAVLGSGPLLVISRVKELHL